MTLGERIERAAMAMAKEGHGEAIYGHEMRAAIEAAYPELHDGTHWLAPNEATEAMIRSAVESMVYVRDWDSEFPRVLEISYSNMRDAYLKEKQDA